VNQKFRTSIRSALFRIFHLREITSVRLFWTYIQRWIWFMCPRLTLHGTTQRLPTVRYRRHRIPWNTYLIAIPELLQPVTPVCK